MVITKLDGTAKGGVVLAIANQFNIPVKYIGPLSRFKEGIKEDIKYSAIIILSGPEPQRSLLEEKMINSFQKYTNEKFLLVRGRPDINETFSLNNNITVVNHLDTKHMQQAIAESEFVISRCGYTTVMEMLSLKKKTILIPTHGQTEQEYLATHLMQQQWAFCCKQDDDFETQFELAKNFIYTLPSFHNSLLEEIITKSIDRLILKD